MRLVPVLATLLIMALVYALDLPKALGAHPFWSRTIVLIGTPIGMALAGAALFGLKVRWQAAVGFAALTLVAMLVAAQGKADFAASYAEDRFAGRLWYFGWIAAAAMAAAAVTSGIASLRARFRSA